MLEKLFFKGRLLFFGVSIFFFSCSQNIIAPEKIISDEETGNLVRTILYQHKQKYQTFEENALLSVGEKVNLRVDWLIKKKDETNAVINYVGQNDDKVKELSNQKVLNEYFIHNIYFVSGTEREINLKIEDFINKDFKN